MKGNRIAAAGAFLLALAVVLGAFGAHALKSRLSPDQLANWRTGVEYHFYHALGLLLVGLLTERLGAKASRWMASLHVAGVVLFSGSLYLLSAKDLLGIEGSASILGPITPLGGLCFIAGWLALFITALRHGDRG
jgi:uncharacterized membrane protein YgdD (TMEM256/DUF423 family)